MTKGKYLGIDFGDRRVGIALSDFNKEIAFPRDFLEYKNTRQLIRQIRNLCEEEHVIKIILGLPIQMDGTFGERAKKTQKFFSQLKKAMPHMDIEFFDERLTTKSAEKRLQSIGIKAKEQKGEKDAISAQMILANYMLHLR